MENPPGWDTIPGAHGSTPEAEGFRDAYAEFKLLGYEVFGMSSQAPAEQEAFAARAGIPYLLLSDEKLAFADALKLPRFHAGAATYLRRLTMIVRDGIIYRALYPVHPPATHAQELLQSLSSARA
jgi:peroxiredoxin